MILALAAMFSGCATNTTRYAVNVDAVCNPTGTDGWSYTLTTDASGRLSSDSRYPEVVNRIHLALSQRGMFQAPDPAEAAFVIAFEYGERAPQARVTTVTQPAMVQPNPLGVGPTGATLGTNPYGRGGPYQSAAPQVVMVQSTQVIRTSEKYLLISARENPVVARQRGAPPAEVWRVQAIIDDESADVYKCIPALVDAVIEYMGFSTAETQTVIVELG